MAAQNMPAAEVEITIDLVRTLLDAQFPDLVALPLTLVANGWDNAIHRLGDGLAVRMPRRQLGADLVAHEHRWLPELATRLPIPIPAPVHRGAPGAGYPWSWSICPWFEGTVAADAELADATIEACRLGDFLAALHQPAPPDAPYNEFRRGQPVAEFIPRIEANLANLDAASDPVRAGSVPARTGSNAVRDWSAGLPTLIGRNDGEVRAGSVPARTGLNAVRDRLAEFADVAEWGGPALWLHGDLHSANMIVVGGEISAILDFGDITSGDPAVDLAVAWMLFDEADRAVFRAAAGATHPIDDATWQRSQLWALHFALLYLLHSADSPRFERMGTALLQAVLE